MEKIMTTLWVCEVLSTDWVIALDPYGCEMISRVQEDAEHDLRWLRKMYASDRVRLVRYERDGIHVVTEDED